MKFLRKTMAILMSATILSGTGAVAASAYTESDIVETSTTIRSADDASVTEFTFDKKTGELTLEKCCDADFEYGNGEPGDNVPWNNFRDEIKTVSFSKEIESIPDGCFRECVNLKKVTVPENVKSIGRMAFYECESLDHIELPSKLESIGAYAFDYTAYYSHSRNWDEIGKGLYIGNYLISVVSTVSNFKARDDTTLIAGLAFRHTDLLEAVSLPESLKYISEYAFAGRYRLTSVNIPASVKTIGRYAFSACKKLKNVTFNEGLESIEGRAFSDCDSLTEIKLPSSLKYVDGFRGCDGLTSVTIPEGLEEIGFNAFCFCSSLKTLTIPRSVTCIEDEALACNADGFTIKGYKNTAAHEYAKKFRTRFFDLETQQITDYGKKNPIKVTAKSKTLKAKTLKAKKVKVKLLTVKTAKGKVSYTILGVSKKLKGKVSVSKKGVFTFKKGKYKKGTFKIKVYVQAKGNTEYLEKYVKKIIKVKIK